MDTCVSFENSPILNIALSPTNIVAGSVYTSTAFSDLALSVTASAGSRTGARKRQAMQSGTHFAKTGGFCSHGTRLFHACWGAAPIPAEHKICVLERWIRPRGLRILRLTASGKAQSLHRSSSPHKATALRGTPSIGCAIFQIAYGQAAQRCSASFSRRSFASSCSLPSSRIRSMLALAVSSSFISSRAFR